MDDIYQKLLDSSFRFLSFRPRSEKEVRDFLLKKLARFGETDVTVIETVISRLQELHYVDDQKFIAWWVEQRSSHKPKGKKLLSIELQQKGIARALIDECVMEDTSGPSEETLAKKAVEKKLERWHMLEKEAKKKKIYEFLLRRGFSSSVVWRVVDELVGVGYNRA